MADYAQYYDYLTGSGVIVPDTSTVLTDVQNEWKEVFGQDLSVTPETPQGRIIEMIARQRIFTLQMAAAVSNMLNIDKAYGFILDDIGALFQLQRKAATKTTVVITMSGVDGTVIPVGTQLRSDDGYIFVNKEEYTITSGSVSGTFEAVDSGTIYVEAQTITTIVTPVDGLETVINNADATVGEEQESDTEFRNRIKASLDINSMSALSAITSAVASLDNVIQVKGYENTSNSAVILDTDFSIPAHGIGIVVDYNEVDISTQETATAIAKVIYEKKTLGAGQITNATEAGAAYIVHITYDDISGDSAGHNITFAKPKVHNVACTVRVLRKNYSGDDLEGDVKNAIAQFLAGENPEVDRVEIGGSLSPFEISAAISSSVPDIFIESVTIGDVGEEQGTSVITLGEAEKLVISPSNITVQVVA